MGPWDKHAWRHVHLGPLSSGTDTAALWLSGTWCALAWGVLAKNILKDYPRSTDQEWGSGSKNRRQAGIRKCWAALDLAISWNSKSPDRCVSAWWVAVLGEGAVVPWLSCGWLAVPPTKNVEYCLEKERGSCIGVLLLSQCYGAWFQHPVLREGLLQGGG